MTYKIKWRKSKDLLEAYIRQHNSGQPALRYQLRSTHKQLAEQLLYLYSVAIDREQQYGDAVRQGKSLPLLRANNVQLAQKLGCSERTVINLRKRLVDARVITQEVFHGGNAQYELQINPQVLHIEQTGRPENVIYYFAVGYRPSQQQAPEKLSGGGVKSLRHTVSSTIPGTNKLIELSGANFQQGAENQQIEAKKPVEKVLKAEENRAGGVENPQTGSGPGTNGEPTTGYTTATSGPETPPQVATAPPEHAPEHIEEVVGHLPREIADQIRRHVTVIWTAANLQLYADRYIHDQEADRAKAALAEYFAYARPDRFGAGASEILERIILVRRWIDRCARKGQKKWLKLPGTYFNFRNPRGFVATKKWYRQHIQAKAEIKGKELLTKAINEYVKSLKPGARISTSETYRRISQRLGKWDKALLDRFHQQINELCKLQEQESQKLPTVAATN